MFLSPVLNSNICLPNYLGHTNGLYQDCSNSIANVLELLQYSTKPSILGFKFTDDLDRWLTFASHGRADFNSVTISEYLWGSIGAIEPHQSRFVRAPLRAQFTNPTLIQLTWKGHTVRDLTLATISNGNWVNFTEFNHIFHTVILLTAHPFNYIRLFIQQNNPNSVYPMYREFDKFWWLWPYPV